MCDGFTCDLDTGPLCDRWGFAHGAGPAQPVSHIAAFHVSRGQPGMWKKANVRPSVFLASIDLNHSSRDHKVSPTTLETRIFEAELPTFADI